MQEKLKPYIKHAYAFILRLQDVRFAGQMLFVVIVLLISWSGVKAIESNYQLQRQISALEQQTDIQKLKNTNLRLQNDYFSTNQYLELSARQNFGLAAPGEKELIVPKDAALAHTVPVPQITESTKPKVTKQSRFEQNYQAWVNFFMHRQSGD
jgi:cell division protein FtsL